MNIPSQGLEVVIGVLGAEVPRAQDVLDLARHQQLFELGREAVAAMGDVEVSQHQHQLQEVREGDTQVRAQPVSSAQPQLCIWTPKLPKSGWNVMGFCSVLQERASFINTGLQNYLCFVAESQQCKVTYSCCVT